MLVEINLTAFEKNNNKPVRKTNEQKAIVISMLPFTIKNTAINKEAIERMIRFLLLKIYISLKNVSSTIGAMIIP